MSKLSKVVLALVGALLLGVGLASPAPAAAQPVTCTGVIDVMLVLDDSGSIDPFSDGVALKNAAKGIVDGFTLGDDATRFGVVRFGDDATLLQGLTTNRPAIDAAIDSLTFMFLTNIEAGLVIAGAELAGNGRAGVPGVIVLITDGDASAGGDPVVAANALRAAGRTIVTVGVGSFLNPAVLAAMSSSGSAILVDDFDALPTIIAQIIAVSCAGGTLEGDLSVLPCLYPVPGGSVVGDVPAGAQVYWRPGDVSPGLVLNPGTYWVIGQDASETYYKVSLACQARYVWIRKDTAGPSFQAPQNGAPLPTRIVQ